MKKPKDKPFRLGWLEVALLFCVLAVAGWVYWQRLWQLRFFTYDQARDALYVSRLLKGEWRLIGTQSSIPGLYTAPFYYYLMAPFLALFASNPVGIDFATGLGTLFAGGLIYYLLRQLKLKPVLAGLVVGAFLFSPQVVHQSRFGWNPNPLPFLVVITLLGLSLALVEKKPRGWWLVGVGLGLSVNFHYSGLGLVFGVGLVSLLTFKRWREDWRQVLVGALFAALLISPLLLFDLRHGWVNFQAVKNYLARGTGGQIAPPPFWPGLWAKHRSLMGLIFPFEQGKNLAAAGWLIWLGLVSFKRVGQKKDVFLAWGLIIYLAGLFFASAYRGSWFLFYLTFLYPLPFVLTGLGLVGSKRWVKLGLGLCLLTALLTPLFKETHRLNEAWFEGRYGQLDLVAFSFSTRLRPEEKVNYVAIYEDPERYDYNAVDYRYFIEALYGRPVPGWDVVDYQQADYLYLISEVGEVDPLEFECWETGLFGPTQNLGYWQVGERTFVYKLGRN